MVQNASAELVSRHGGAHQPDWGIAVGYQWGQAADGSIVKVRLRPRYEMMQLLRDKPLDREYAGMRKSRLRKSWRTAKRGIEL